MKTELTETILQQHCVKWFRLQYPKAAGLLFSIPNEGKRSKANSWRMKAEGMRAGVSDLFLAIPRSVYNGLWIEMKTQKGVLSAEQKEFQADMQAQGYATTVCRSIEEFMNAIRIYLK